jgi:glycosyltransferase involved in cell wall biosynthesis
VSGKRVRKDSEKPSILIVAPCAFPLDRGTPIRIERLATLMSQKYDVHVATFHQGREKSLPFTVHRIIRLPFDLTQSSGATIGKFVSDIFLLLLVLVLIPKHRIRLVDGHLHEGALIALLGRLIYRVPAIYNSHGTLAAEMIASGIISAKSFAARAFQWLEDRIETSVDLILAQSTMRRDDFIRKGVPRERIAIVEDAPLFEDYEGSERDGRLRQRYGGDHSLIIIYTGELMLYQGVDMIFDALPGVFERHPETRVILFGRPVAPYRDRAASAGIAGRVFLVDDEPFERLGVYLTISDIALAPRLYGGNVPGKLPIYMCSGKAIIGTNVEGINTVLEHGRTGWLIEPTAEALSEGLNTLIARPDVRERIANGARDEARRRYSPKVIEDAMCAAYEGLIRG